MVALARGEGRPPMSAGDIAAAQRIPVKFLERILSELKRAGYIKSARGAQGGYLLARPAVGISLAEIVRTLDGALAPTGCVSKFFYDSTPIEREPGLVDVFRSIRDFIAEQMERTTLADVSGRKTRPRSK